ncbi:MAG: hypothetical protein J6334_06960 [Kiritimatiellae bacterium]|nr:hypothetical protein [Kiritimatiellia bacterium]
MALSVSRTTQPLRFDTGIGQAGFAEVIDAPGAGAPQHTLLPGSTTVSQAIDALFPTDQSVSGEIMKALVAENSAYLRTPGGFNQTARSVADTLRGRGTEVAERAAREIETLLADTDLFEHYRATLLET